MRKVLCISGFLGAKNDWDFLDKRFFEPLVFNPTDFDGSFDKTALQISKKAQAEGVQWILGYSMGGRLALSNLVQYPLFKGAVIISAHTGLKDNLEKSQRVVQDTMWAHKFETEPWQELLTEWNSQPVFNGSREPLRAEGEYNRAQLSRVLTTYSLGKQPDLSEPLKKVNIPILFVAGSRDEKYKQLVRSAKDLNPRFSSLVIENAGHRVIFDSDPQKLNADIIQFMEKA